MTQPLTHRGLPEVLTPWKFFKLIADARRHLGLSKGAILFGNGFGISVKANPDALAVINPLVSRRNPLPQVVGAAALHNGHGRTPGFAPCCDLCG